MERKWKEHKPYKTKNN